MDPHEICARNSMIVYNRLLQNGPKVRTSGIGRYLSPELPYQLVVDDVHLTCGCIQAMCYAELWITDKTLSLNVVLI